MGVWVEVGKVTEDFWDPVAAFGFVQGNALLRRVSETTPITNKMPISFSKSVIVDTAHFSKSVFS